MLALASNYQKVILAATALQTELSYGKVQLLYIKAGTAASQRFVKEPKIVDICPVACTHYYIQDPVYQVGTTCVTTSNLEVSETNLYGTIGAMLSCLDTTLLTPLRSETASNL